MFCIAALPFASAQNQSTALAPSTVNSMPANDSAMGAQASQDLAAQAEQTDLNSPNFTHPDFQGTLLEKAYQQESQSGWQDPNLTKSTGTIGPGGE
jgi:uncharacterized protein YjbI with pentapeptide repeats